MTLKDECKAEGFTKRYIVRPMEIDKLMELVANDVEKYHAYDDVWYFSKKDVVKGTLAEVMEYLSKAAQPLSTYTVEEYIADSDGDFFEGSDFIDGEDFYRCHIKS